MIRYMLLFCLFSGCSYSYPDSYEAHNFIFIKQQDHISCGPTSALMLLKFAGQDVEIEEVRKHSKTEWFRYKDEAIGMTAPDVLSIAINQLGIPAHMRRGNLDKLKYYISQRRFPLVLLRSGPTTWHYVVAIGYDPEHIIVADPGPGKSKAIKSDHFTGAWRFETDMSGSPVKSKCQVCGGTGQIGYLPGPLGYCDFCRGSGKTDDILNFIVRVAEVSTYTMIVPDNPI